MSDLDEDRAAELLDRAAALAAAGDVGEAGQVAVEAAHLLSAGDEDRPDTFLFGAQLLERAGRFAAAGDAWAALAFCAGDDATRARALTAEGEAARRAGDWARAADAQTRALSLAEAAFGESTETAAVAQNLAVIFKYTGRFDDAKAIYLRALAMAEAADDQRLVAVICHNLGGLAHARGDHAEGIPWARRSVEVRTRLDDPVALAGDRGALAGLLIDAGEHDEALDLLHVARTVFAEHLGEDDYEVAVVDGNLATIALAAGDLAEADLRARSSLAGKERHLGDDHPELAVTLTTLGTIRRRQGDASHAVALHRRARAVLAPAVEPDHPLLRTIDENLAIANEDAEARRRRRMIRR